jgi:glycerol-3-phosphate dehydrogenase (NAD(P)+)
MTTKVAVVGAGSWGTTVASLLCNRTDTVLWARREDVAREINETHRNSSYLGESTLPARLVATSSLEEAVSGATLVVMGVPSHGYREVLGQAAAHLGPVVPIISLSKGFEQGSLLRMSEVSKEICPDNPVGVLTGPNLAREILAGQPAASVVAIADEEISRELQRLFSSDTLRIYTNPDVTGCETAGAVKNVMAIACGMASGLGFGDNTLATVITRSLAELARLGVALGGDPLTFSGLAGLGDLVATCTSPQSRNRTVGVELGKGQTLEQIQASMRMVAEGVKTSRPVVQRAHELGVEVPIAEQVVAVLYEGKPPAATITSLMRRSAKAELHGIRI